MGRLTRPAVSLLPSLLSGEPSFLRLPLSDEGLPLRSPLSPALYHPSPLPAMSVGLLLCLLVAHCHHFHLEPPKSVSLTKLRVVFTSVCKTSLYAFPTAPQMSTMSKLNTPLSCNSSSCILLVIVLLRLTSPGGTVVVHTWNPNSQGGWLRQDC